MQLARSLIVKDATPNSGNSIFFSVSVCLFPNSSKTANPSELKLRDDSPWDGKGFRLKNIRIRRTVGRKIACIVGSILAILAVNLYIQYEASTYLRGW